ncbi:MAG: protein kinase [Symploca sp. SIO2E6]|nr:protein kinase [Symploca sp. SIO2E6]
MPGAPKKTGELINKRYKVIRPLSEGGQGITYIVRDEQSNIPNFYVIKQLKQHDKNSVNARTIEISIKRFKQEADILEDLTKDGVPQIPRYENYFEREKEYYLVQEFIQGKTLKEILYDVKRLNKFQVIAFLQDVLNILSRIHGYYITPNNNVMYHRDIKPSNLMWQEDKGHMVILDFGTTKYKHLTVTGFEAYGTPPYAAPELWVGNVYPSSDIYSLGVTAIQALTGKPPRGDSNINESDRGLIGDDLADILEKMIRSKAQERYQSVQEVLDVLKPLSLVGNVLRQRYRITRVVDYLNQENFNTETINHTYIAIDTRTFSREVIIREFCPQRQDTQVLQEAQGIFNEECRKLEEISSFKIAIPRLLDYFYEDSKFYIVYQVILGRYLNQDIFFNQELKHNWREQQVIQFLKNILSTLASMHDCDCLHLDIKPSKILTTDQDTVYLTGAARIEEIANLSSNPHGGIMITTPVGTADYMPPEQQRGHYFPNSDLYSLGITAIQLLTGKEPQTIKTDKVSKNLWPRNIRVQTGLKKILEQMVDESPIQGRRYQSAQEVIDDLNKLPKSDESFFPINSIKNRGAFRSIIAAIFVIVAGLFLVSLPRLQVIIKHNQATDKLGEAEETTDINTKTLLYKSALEEFNNILEKKPNFYQARVSKAYIMGKLDFPENEIKTECQQAIKDQDKFAGAYNCLGEVFNRSGKRRITSDIEAARRDFKDAIFYYERAIEFDAPEKYNFNDGLTKHLALYNRGEVYGELKQLATEPQQQLEYCKLAKESFEEALQAKPDFAAAKQEIEKIGDCSSSTGM